MMDTKTDVLVKSTFTFGPRLKFLTLTFALIVFYTTLLFSATIYIDPSSTNSSPNGTMSNPYKTWAGINFINGNTYVQKKGTTYTSSTQILIGGKNNVTIGAYGSGNRPIFSYTGSGYAFRVDNSNSCTVEDFEVNGNGNAHSLIYFSGTEGNYTQNNKAQNLNLHNAHNTNNAGFGVYGWHNNNLKLLNIEIHNIALDGMYLQNITNVEIGYCNVYDINRRYFINSNESASSGDGIQLNGYYTGFHIHHTTIDRTNGALNKYSLILNSAAGKSDNATGILEYNTFINSAGLYSAILIERGNGIITRYNTFKGASRGLRLGGAYTKNNLIHNNIFYNSTFGVVIGYTYPSVGPCTGTKVYNNVFYNTEKHISVDRGNVVSRNNIHYRTNNSDVAIYNYGGGSWTISNNCYSTAAAAGTPGTGTAPIIGNPLFVNASSYNFRLQSNSPCIDKGTNVGLSNDIEGNAIFSGTAPDIGPYEYTSSTGTNQTPVISNQTFSVMSNATNGATVGTVVATDPNAGQTLTYSITGGNTGTAFSIVATTGILKVNNASALTTSSFALIVKVTDNGVPVMNSSATITVNVTQANRAPVIANQTFSVMSNASNGTTVGTVVASDPDAGQTLTYAITAGNTGTAFSIVATTGVLKVNNTSALSASSFELIVNVTDNGSPSLNTSATITVNVTQANRAPIITNQTFSILSSATNGSTVGTVNASDPDAGQTLTYAITAGNTSNAFSIVAATGLLKVNNSSALSTSSFGLTVKVTDNGSPSLNSSATISVNVTQVNRAPVIANQTFSVMSNTSNGTTVGTVVASDPDAGQTLSYAITSGNTSNAFSVGATTGILTVNNTSALTVPSFTLTVKVTDNGSPVMNSTATVTINVTQANQAPVIANQTFSVMSDATNGTSVGTVIATDPNAGQSLTYSITAGNTGSAFSITASSGLLKVNNASAISSSSFALIIKVSDNGSPIMNSSATITVNVIQANRAPVIANQNFEIQQTATTGTVIGTILASDPDAGQVLAFSIISGNSNGIFGLNGSTGALSVLIPAALTTGPKYLNIRVTDNGTPSLYSEATITIEVIATNNAPVMVAQTFTSTPYPPIGSILGTIQATDPDEGQTLTYTFATGNSNGIFNLNPTTGVVTVAISYPLYPRNFYLTARVTDNGNPSLYTEALITISIQNINNPPIVEPQTFIIEAGSVRGTPVGTIIASDPDMGQRVTFLFTSGNSFGIFDLNEMTGDITVNLQGALYPRCFYMYACVTDNGTPAASTTVLISIKVLAHTTTSSYSNIPSQSFVAEANEPEGSVIGNLKVDDVLTGSSITYVIDNDQEESTGFAVDPVNGAITIDDMGALTPGLTIMNINIYSNDHQSIVARTRAKITVKSSSLMVVDEQVGFIASFEAQIYPNPSPDGRFTLTFNSNSRDEYVVQVTDLAGRLLMEPLKSNDKQLNLDLSNQPRGTYLVVVQHNGTMKSIKAIRN